MLAVIDYKAGNLTSVKRALDYLGIDCAITADPDGTMRVNEEEPLPGSHRHFSNLMNIYPFNLTTIEGSDRDRQIIRASLAQYDRFGTKAWCGYSFTWMAAGTSPISSRNTVPVSACSNLPGLVMLAPVNAPFS